MSLDYKHLGVLFTIGLLKNLRDAKFRDDLIPFWKIDEEFRKRGLDYEQQTIIMNLLATAGFFKLVNFKGWCLKTPPAHAENTCTVLAEPESDIHTDTKVAEVAKPSEPIHESDPTVDVEFGHVCHGCARYPCEKLKAGEPADCWDYIKIEE